MLKIQLYITGMSYILKYIHIENIYFEIINNCNNISHGRQCTYGTVPVNCVNVGE